MSLDQIKSNVTPSILRQFAVACLVFACGAGILLWERDGRAAQSAFLVGLGLALGICGLIWPTSVRLLYLAAVYVTFPIGWLVSQVLMSLLFYGLITPIAVIFRLVGRDRLCLRRPVEAATYWRARPADPPPLASYFRQF